MDYFQKIELPPDHAVEFTMAHPGAVYFDERGNPYVRLIVAKDIGAYLIIDRPLPVLALGTAIGDIVHNLRSALDQLTWELSVRHQRSLGVNGKPLPKSTAIGVKPPWRDVQFPVCDAKPSWPGHVSRKLRLIDQCLVPKFDDEQPHQCGKRYQRHWLWLLQELWNRDKHRSITLAAQWGTTRAVTLRPANLDPMTMSEFHTEFHCLLRNAQSTGRYTDGVKLAQFRVVRRNPRLSQPQANFYVETQLRLRVKFKQAAPTYGRELLDTLQWLSANVERVLNGFKSDFR
jgi:hypothetical protein